MKDNIRRVGSRDSALAVAQSHMVMEAIAKSHPHLSLELVTMKTTGDKILDRPLDKIGGKGLFVKELDEALVEYQVDITVHSGKDLPMELKETLPLVAFSKREDPRDVLVLPRGAEGLDTTKPIGCSSKRRGIFLQTLYPEATVAPIRGNLQTRLAKLDRGEFGGLVLAAAGLKRMGLEHRISRIFTPEEMLPACGQGILAVQGRLGEDTSFLQGFHSKESEVCILAERAFTRYLDGGCSSPVAAYATLAGENLTIQGLYIDAHGNPHRGSVSGHVNTGISMAEGLARQLKEGTP